MQFIDYKVEERLAYIFFNRPDKMNAFTVQMQSEFCQALRTARDDSEVWAIVITGRGKAFSAGHDLSEYLAVTKLPPDDDHYRLQTQIHKPIISAVNGVCFAQAATIAMASDICVASEHARFGWPQVKRGITAKSGPVLLARRIPLNKAIEILFTGESLTAQQALDLNLVNYVVPHAELMSATEGVARRILESAPLAVSAVKETVLESLSMRPDEALKFANLVFERVQWTEDAQEGLRAFQEKRAPVWKGR